MNSPQARARAIPSIGLSFLLLAATPLIAQTNGTWINASSNSPWSTVSNWSGGSVGNGADATADFSTLDIAANRTVNLGANRTLGTLLFGDAVTPSNTWTLANGTGGPWALTLATTSAAPVIQVNNQTTTISALIAGTQGFTKTGSGTLTLSNVGNTLTGGIALSAGTLNFASSALGGNLVTVTANATLGWSSGNAQDVSAQLKLDDGVTATLATGANHVTFGTALQTGSAGTAAITKTGAGSLTFTAVQTYTGTTRVNGGRIVLAGGDDRLLVSGTVLLGQGANSGILQLGDANGAVSQTIASLAVSGTGLVNAVVGGAAAVSTLRINNANAVSYAGLIGGVGTNENLLALHKSGAGALTLTNSGSTFAGDVFIAGGRVTVTQSAALGTGPKLVMINGTVNAPTLELDGSGGGLSLASGLSFITSNDNTNTPAILSSAGSNAIAGAISLTTGGFGTGNTRIKVTAGSLALTGAIVPDVSAASAVTVILDASAGASGSSAGTLADNGATVLALTKAGAGVWALSGNNAYTGTTAINAGTLQVSSVAANGVAQPLGTASTAISLGANSTSGTLEYVGTVDATLARGITVATAAGGTVSNSGGAVLVLGGTLSKNGRPLTLAGGNFLVTGRITGATAGDLIVDAATVTLSNNSNTYVGSTFLQNGSTLSVTNTSGSATGTGTLTVAAGSTLAGTGRVSAGTDNSILIQGRVQVGTAGAAADLEVGTAGTGSTAFAAGSLLMLDLFSGAGAGDQSGNALAADVLKVTGALDIAPGTTLKLTNPNHLTAWAEGDVFKLLDWSGLSVRTGTFDFDVSALDLPSNVSLDTRLLYSAGTIAFVVPEPNRALLLVLGVTIVVLRRSRS